MDRSSSSASRRCSVDRRRGGGHRVRFRHPGAVVPIDAETEALYSDIIARWIANLTATPDFPTSAALAKGWWSTLHDDRIDGVISIDPIGLSYMLNATGPITLPTGDVLTSENAAPLLLNEAYFKYPDGADSNRFFSAVSLSVFGALTGGSIEPVPMMAALTRAADEGRLKIWSSDEDEARAARGSRHCPDGSRRRTTRRVRSECSSTTRRARRWTTTSMPRWRVQADRCAADAPRWTTTVTLQNHITADAAGELPRYITGPYFTPGNIGTDFVVYTPVDATIEGWTLNGKPVDAIAHTTHLGRDAVRVNVVLPPESTATLEVAMVGTAGSAAADLGPTTVRHTPMVRETPVSVDEPTCD
ncbi:hypothetical protein CTI14_27960 [Methylobacterium radiotolerans]|nr:hypothetical protein CTI14_27960 [Methylobacterium radiotolerans]